MIERFVPRAGGVENVAWQVAHELGRQGEDVTVVAREADPASTVPVDMAPAPAFWQPLRVLRFSASARRATEGRAFDVVHSFARTRHQDLYRAGGGTHHDYLTRTHRPAGRALRHLSPRHRVLLDIERQVFRRSTQRIQCASRLVADALEADYGVDPDRILLLPNAVRREEFDGPDAERAGRALRARLDPRAETIFVLPGSGWRRKGLATALEALARLDDSNSRLWVAGRDAPAPWRRRAFALGIADRVRFLGDRADMPAVYHAADVAVLPTRYDPFANATLEAAAAGLPVVTTPANGAAEWLGEDVLLVDPPDDAEALAAVLGSIGTAGVRRARGARLAAHAARLDWSSHAKALRAEYEAIVARREVAGR